MNLLEDRKQLAIISVCAFGIVGSIVFCAILFALQNKEEQVSIVLEKPDNWAADYTENVSDYDSIFKDGESYSAFSTDQFTTVEEEINTASVVDSFTAVLTNAMTATDAQIAQMTEDEAWNCISNGIWTSYPKGSFASNKDKLVALQQANTETITVDCWYWANPSDDTDMSKITVQKTFAVNTSIASLFKHAFADIYNDPSKPIINISDKGMGTWVLRGKNHNANNTMSSHALGCAIDINPSTGSFQVNGTWYGNAYKHKKMSKAIWESLPECHKKYHVLYDGSPIVEIFKSYGFYWGGDWSSGTDCMHLAFIGDGSSARANGISNYNNRN